MDEIVIRLHDRRLEMRQKLDVLNNLPPVIALATVGLEGLHAANPWARAFSWLELAVAALVVVTVGREMRHLRRHTPKTDADDAAAIEWVDVVAATVLFTEAAQRYVQTGKPSYAAIVAGIFTLGQGRLRAHMVKRRGPRQVRVSDEGIRAKLAAFRRFDVPWSDVERVERGPKVMYLHRVSGKRHRIGIKRYYEGAHVADAIVAQAAARGIPVTEPPPPRGPR
jgi:hypothetical protein